MEKLIKIIVFFSLFLIQSAIPASASLRCTEQYGGKVCAAPGRLQINKKVFNPSSQTFVDNLGLSDRRFVSGEKVSFQIIVQNVGESALTNVKITDTLPQQLKLTSSATSFTITNLAPGASEERQIQAEVVFSDNMPKGGGTQCVVNTAGAKSNEEEHDQDTAQVCIEQKAVALPAAQVIIPKQLPPTGPNDWALYLGGSLISGFAGFVFLRLGKRFASY